MSLQPVGTLPPASKSHLPWITALRYFSGMTPLTQGRIGKFRKGAQSVSPLLKLPLPALILVADDQTPNRILLEEMLTAKGFRVATAADGAEALAEFNRIKPELETVAPIIGFDRQFRIAINLVCCKAHP
jgi:hypothetical protein